MRKVLLALVVLLHLHYSHQNKKLNGEIIKKLKALGNVSLKEGRVPNRPMETDPSICVSSYVSELKLILDNVTGPPKHSIQELKGNLQQLDLNQLVNPLVNPPTQQNCPMMLAINTSRIFRPYIRFFRDLNSKKQYGGLNHRGARVACSYHFLLNGTTSPRRSEAEPHEVKKEIRPKSEQRLQEDAATAETAE
ncbi:hypothetical protein PBY51_016239 [Eleginops maclovinus]|uniref:Uncharacterized protein n=1 Tax=Eleginops maclovinus TaxID=56733 RepID=A0AAN7XQJ3_ELEMC|nr:hypothetical protein PBY51_016239 [Eleginops maclovinus]